ncbi:MAG: YihY/virulence factor BrkB family protein, partial [Ktedonobacterales bacterium]|nr:YihY/virulence factor BrkB family protein [Ktedonobacterales bacterium]
MAATTASAAQDQSGVQKVEQKARPLLDFWQKVTYDWVPQMAGMLAYSFLTSIIPLMLVIIAIGGFVVGAISPGSAQQLQNTIQSALPSGIGQQVVTGALNTLHRSAGLLLLIGVASALFSGSRLFVAIENSAGIVFRLRGRDGLHQNIMAVCMTLLYVVLVPLIFVASVVPGKLLHLVGLPTDAGFGALVAQGLGIVVSIGVAFVLFVAIFIVVPNRPVTWKEAWRGAAFTAVLLVVYELLFPLYTTYLIKPGNYGSLAGFALVFLAFFYYLAFILLVGMEINSWMSGQRQTASDVASIIHEVQAHNTTRGAAGPTAGTPQEDQQNNKGAAVMATDASAIQHEREDHHDDVK